MKSTREKVLQTLAGNPRSTIVEIADSVGINAISVRHHLTNLQAANLVTAEEERHGVGRPRLVYYLTDQGLENFPTRYYRLTNSLIEQIKETLSDSEVKKLFKAMADKLSHEYQPIFESLGFEEKLALLKTVMEKEGYELGWERKGDAYEIDEIACPFYQIGRDHPEICLFDKSLISNLLSVPEENIKHLRTGENRCTFQVQRSN
jgi:DeoR family suf operon transcriptional repressor